MSLADDIYEASGRGSSTDPVDELVEMAINKSAQDRHDEFTFYQLHIRDGEIYHGHEKVEESRNNVYLLTGYMEKIPEPQLLLFWPRLKKHLPKLDLSIIQISDNLFFDRNIGSIIKKEELYERYTGRESTDDGCSSENV